MRGNYRTHCSIQRGKSLWKNISWIQFKDEWEKRWCTRQNIKILVKNLHFYVLIQFVEITEIHSPQSEIYRNMLSYFFDKKFVKATFLLKKILKSWFDEFILGDSKFFIFPHCVQEGMKRKGLENPIQMFDIYFL